MLIPILIVIVYYSSLHRRHRVEHGEILPVINAVADAREELPCGPARCSAGPAGADLSTHRIDTQDLALLT